MIQKAYKNNTTTNIRIIHLSKLFNFLKSFCIYNFSTSSLVQTQSIISLLPILQSLVKLQYTCTLTEKVSK